MKPSRRSRDDHDETFLWLSSAAKGLAIAAVAIAVELTLVSRLVPPPPSAARLRGDLRDGYQIGRITAAPVLRPPMAPARQGAADPVRDRDAPRAVAG